MNNGSILNLYNYQGVVSNPVIYGPLYLGGNIPTNYIINLNSISNYGQLYYTQGYSTLTTTNMTFTLNLLDSTTINTIENITSYTIFKNVIVGLELNSPPSQQTYSSAGKKWSYYLNYNLQVNYSNTGLLNIPCYDLIIIPFTNYNYYDNTNTFKDFAEVFKVNSTGSPIQTTQYYLNNVDFGTIFACYTNSEGMIDTLYYTPVSGIQTDLGKILIPINTNI